MRAAVLLAKILLGASLTIFGYSVSQVVQIEAETSVIRERNVKYKHLEDVNGDGRKDAVYSGGSIFLQTSLGKYERVSPAVHNGSEGYITRNRKFYDLKGQTFDLNSPKPTPQRRRAESDGQVMLT